MAVIDWPEWLKDRVSWVLLLRISQSFISKMFTGISFSVFVLSHVERFAFLRSADTSFRIIMVGGLAFLRIDMLESMIERTNNNSPPDLSPNPVRFAKITIKRAREATPGNWKESSAALYLADLNLRQFDAFSLRMAAFACLVFGLLATSYSTLAGIVVVLKG